MTKPEWDFRKIDDNTPKVFSCIEKDKVRFFENPYIPEKELLEKYHKLSSKISIFIIPPSSPYLINKLLEHFPLLSHIIVVDASEERLDSWKKLTKGMFSKDIKTFLLSKDAIQDKEQFLNLFPADFAPLYLWKVALYFPPGYMLGEQKFFSYIQTVMKLSKQEIELRKMYHTGDMWHHMLNQLTLLAKKEIKKHTFSKTKANAPFVVVGAGPSLDENVEVLKKHKDKAIILCCERAIGTLKHHNIKPDFILTIENVLGMWYHFESHYDFIKDIPLISPMLISHIVSKKYPGDKVFIKMKGLENWLNELDNFLEVDLGHCVGQFGFNVASAFGASEIILIGNDLAFKDGRTHSCHTHREMLPKAPLKVKGFYGGEVETSRTFKYYIEGFQNMISKTTSKVINATEGGAHIPGAKHISLKQALASKNKCKKLDYREIPSEKAYKFYQDMVFKIFEIQKKLMKNFDIFQKQKNKKIEPFFDFIPNNYQEILNHFINPEIFLQYYDILNVNKEFRINEYRDVVAKLTKMTLYACNYILNINAILSHKHQPKLNFALVLKPKNLDVNDILKGYPQIEFFIIDDQAPLIQIWETIARYNIGTLVAFNSKVSPDAWTIPQIKCIDIITNSNKIKHHPVIDYVLAFENEKIKSEKPQMFYGNIPTTTVSSAFEDLSANKWSFNRE